MGELPEAVADEGRRLTRLARRAVDDAEADAYRRDRDEMVAEYGYETRIRAGDDGDVLVCYPAEWVEDGRIRTDRIDDTDRGVERRLDGVGDPDDWSEVASHNDDVVERVAEEHDDVHLRNARALADFASNHYAKPVNQLTRGELREFLDEYFPRNAWPTEEQRACVDESVRLAFEKTGVSSPLTE